MNQTPKNYMGMNIYNLLELFLREKLEKNLKIRNKGNRKTNFIFWNFEDQNEWKNRGKTKEIFRTNIIKEKKKKHLENRKNGKIGQKKRKTKQ
jgi:hypothetical protein